jgi:TFIIF-interacting CTD phosphatase-like protein
MAARSASVESKETEQKTELTINHNHCYSHATARTVAVTFVCCLQKKKSSHFGPKVTFVLSPVDRAQGNKDCAQRKAQAAVQY